MQDDVTTYVKFLAKKTETGKAILFYLNNLKIWIPKSVIVDLNDTDKIIVLQKWFAEKNNIKGDY
jgi:hypothetical protein